MREQRIEIEIDEHGRIKADAHGFTGDACIQDLVKILADCPGAWATVTRKQPEQPSRASTSNQANLKSGGRP